jgi:hypothetical protein
LSIEYLFIDALGFVVINNDDSTWSQTFTTSLPSGSYCDVVSGSTSTNGVCSAAAYVINITFVYDILILLLRYTVTGGSVTLSVLPRSAIGLHTGQVGTGTPSGSENITVTFNCIATTDFGGKSTLFTSHCCLSYLRPENIFITGSISQLSNWSTTNAIALSAASYPIWSVTISTFSSTSKFIFPGLCDTTFPDITSSTNFQYKYIRIDNGAVTWEYDPNRSYTTPSNGTLTIYDDWNGPGA